MSCGINACTLPGRMAGGGCGCGARQPLGIVSNLFRQAGGVCPLALAGYPGRMAGGSSRKAGRSSRKAGRTTCKCLNKVFGAFKGGKMRRRVSQRKTRKSHSRRARS